MTDQRGNESSAAQSVYRANRVSPVGQAIQDLDAHFRHRRSLYQMPGLTSLSVRNRRATAFVPRFGHGQRSLSLVRRDGA